MCHRNVSQKCVGYRKIAHFVELVKTNNSLIWSTTILCSLLKHLFALHIVQFAGLYL